MLQKFFSVMSVCLFVTVYPSPTAAAPEVSSKEEQAERETLSIDPALAKVGTASAVRARLTSTIRRSSSRSACRSADVLCNGVQGSVIVLPGAIVSGDLINAPEQHRCRPGDPRCKP